MEPGYIDLQVNGYAGVDFNRDGLAADALHAACQRQRDDGVVIFLPTIITGELGAMCRRLSAIVRLRDRDPLAKAMIGGVHIEGPFLNAAQGFIGAHPPEHARSADVDAMSRLLDAAGGLTKIVTLAPECDPSLRITRMLSECGIVVAAGHCDPSRELLSEAIDAGLSMFTHMGNGCPLQLSRHDNIIQRVISLANRLHISLIADGAHVPLFVLRNYLQAIPMDRVVIISDATAATGLGPGTYSLGDQPATVGDDGVARNADGYLMGSACPLPRMAENLRSIGIDDTMIRRWTVDNPRKLLRGNKAQS